MSHELINSALLVIAVLFGAYFLVQSRKWTGPSQSVRISMVEDEQRVLRGNLKRVERDTSEWHHSFVSSQDAILRELQSIQRNGAKQHPLEDEMKAMEDRLLDVEQVISTLPCVPDCPIVEIKKSG